MKLVLVVGAVLCGVAMAAEPNGRIRGAAVDVGSIKEAPGAEVVEARETFDTNDGWWAGNAPVADPEAAERTRMEAILERRLQRNEGGTDGTDAPPDVPTELPTSFFMVDVYDDPDDPEEAGEGESDGAAAARSPLLLGVALVAIVAARA